jgi:uncharacterized protein (TIGR02001 family)
MHFGCISFRYAYMNERYVNNNIEKVLSGMSFIAANKFVELYLVPRSAWAAVAGVIGAIGLAGVALPAKAQTEIPSDFDVSGSITIVSDYRWRGLSLTGGGMAIQPNIVVDHASGVYAGVFASNIIDTPVRGDLRTQLYGGYATEIAPGLNIDLGLIYYLHPNGDKAAGNSDYAELASDVSYMLGPIEAQASLNYIWKQSALESDNIYASFSLGGGIPSTPISVRAQVGHMDGGLVRFGSDGHFWDWSIGATANLGRVTAGVRYVDTSIPTTGVKSVDRFYDSQFLFTLGVSF